MLKCGMKLRIYSQTSGASIEVWKCISNFIPLFTGHVITIYVGLKLIHIIKEAPETSITPNWGNILCSIWDI